MIAKASRSFADAIVKKLEMPFFYVAGNHDMSNAVMAEEWKERFGPSYYHFRYRDVLFLVLNTEEPPVPKDPESDAFVAHIVEAVGRTRTLLLLNYRPEYDAAWMKRSDFHRVPLLPLGEQASEDLLALVSIHTVYSTQGCLHVDVSQSPGPAWSHRQRPLPV